SRRTLSTPSGFLHSLLSRICSLIGALDVGASSSIGCQDRSKFQPWRSPILPHWRLPCLPQNGSDKTTTGRYLRIWLQPNKLHLDESMRPSARRCRGSPGLWFAEAQAAPHRAEDIGIVVGPDPLTIGRLAFIPLVG